ncbi:MAG: M20 family metallo-hydrolase [Emergencia timonensis]|uniref:M20 family metallo-hydrolase n=1 Tax=Emergencia timonensis TaxID=1776384 RepID=UPI00083220AA|nr:M20 family metallo-hydrolase [Emergencia timonensis]WNX87133.1 M20 family metallo-hydrolase [Emergencia timonensis]
MDIEKELTWIENAIEELSKTAEKDGISWRASYTPEDQKGTELLKAWMEEKGFCTYFDEVGNLFGRIAGKKEEVILTGSHRDTVKNGGKYDGALGVITAIEGISALYQKYGRPEKTVEVAAFCEEEASRFPTGFIGSSGITGELSEKDLNEKDDDGITVKEAMEGAGYYKEGVLPQKRSDILRTVELHIEQGNVLEYQKKDLGIVTSIVGVHQGYLYFEGHQNHAGTTPMSIRNDPVPVAAELISKMSKWADAKEDRVVCTFGSMSLEPGEANVIPGAMKITFDIRSVDQSLLEEAEALIAYLKAANGEKIKIGIEYLVKDDPIRMDDEGIAIMQKIADEEKYAYMLIDSGAGHDSQLFARYFKSNMIFLPSKDGISHSPEEFTDIRRSADGYRLLKAYMKELAW